MKARKLKYILSKEKHSPFSTREERFIFFNIKAGLQSGIPICCIMYHTFVYSPRHQYLYRNNRVALEKFTKLREEIDYYHKVDARYVRCPECLLHGKCVKILRDEPGTRCSDTTWLKAIKTFAFKRDRFKNAEK